DAKHEQAMRPRITGEVQRGHLCDAWCDAHMLPAEKKEDRPEAVCKLCGQKHRAKRSFRRDTFGRQSKTLMSKKHERELRRSGKGIQAGGVTTEEHRGQQRSLRSKKSSVNLCALCG